MKYVLNFNVMKEKFKPFVYEGYDIYGRKSIIEKMEYVRDHPIAKIDIIHEVDKCLTINLESDTNLNVSIGECINYSDLKGYGDLADSFLVTNKTVRVDTGDSGNNEFVIVIDLKSIKSIPATYDSEEYKDAELELEVLKQKYKEHYQKMIDDYYSKNHENTNQVKYYSMCDDHVVSWDYNPNYAGGKSVWEKIKRLWE